MPYRKAMPDSRAGMEGEMSSASTRSEQSPEFVIRSKDFEPAYVQLYRSGELQRRAREAVAGLAHCLACPRNCGVDRLADKTAACKTGRYARVSSYFPHVGEEDCLRGWNGRTSRGWRSAACWCGTWSCRGTLPAPARSWISSPARSRLTPM